DVDFGVDLKATDPRKLTFFGREHDDEHGRHPPDLPTELQPIDVGEHDIEDDKVRSLLARPYDGFAAVVCGQDIVALLQQVVFHQLDDVRLVVDHEDLLGHLDTLHCGIGD